MTWEGLDQDPVFGPADRMVRPSTVRGRGRMRLRHALEESGLVTYPMSKDRIVGDGGNCTVYERPDGSLYVLDRSGRGGEAPRGTKILGPARFDSRSSASGRWAGSRSTRG